MANKLLLLFSRFKALPNWKKALIIFLILALGYLLLALFGGETIITSPLRGGKNQESEAKTIANPLNGVLYSKKEADVWRNRLPIAVMVENLVEVRPQSGLSRADVVYEALAEGGITRFMPVFLAQEASEIGPIRSARPYYLDWAVELKALYAHIGGSPEALDRIANEGIRTLPEQSPYYIRKENGNLGVEHTAFSSTKGLWQMAQSRDFNGSPSFQSWNFKDNEATSSSRPASATLTLGFSGMSDYQVQWSYNSEKNLYQRFSGSSLKVDTDRANNEQITAKNIIVQYATHTALNDDKNRISINTTGTGTAKIFLDGVVIEGKWEKPSVSSRTIFYDSNNKEITFNRGQIWIEVVPTESKVEYSD